MHLQIAHNLRLERRDGYDALVHFPSRIEVLIGPACPTREGGASSPLEQVVTTASTIMEFMLDNAGVQV